MKSFWERGGVRIFCVDVREWAREYAGEKFHACLTDPPYHLGDAGFMGQAWDSARHSIAFQSDTWAAFRPHLHSGAFLFAFASSRGWHRMACAVEDAGFVFHPSVFLLGWVQAQGFPKATNIAKMLDGVHGKQAHGFNTAGGKEQFDQQTLSFRSDYGYWYKAATPIAATWAGHRYGRQALKPSVEPVVCAQVPYEGKPIECITRTGAGALNIDEARVGVNGGCCNTDPYQPGEARAGYFPGLVGRVSPLDPNLGRWPPNFAMIHTPECRQVGTRLVKSARKSGETNVPVGLRTHTHVLGKGAGVNYINAYGDADGTEAIEGWECASECPVAALNAQAGERGGRWSRLQVEGASKGMFGLKVFGITCDPYVCDTGPVSRFYPNCGWEADVEEQIAGALPVFYTPKARRKEREAGLEDNSPECPRSHVQNRMKCARCGGWQNVGVQSVANRPNSTCQCEEPQYEHQTERVNSVRNTHVAVKPLALTTWLAKLLLPPAAYAPRRIMIPFAGTGSEAIGALQAGFEEIVLVEQSEEYCALAQGRLQYWMARERERQPALLE